MIIKKFVGKTEEEATALAKKELGQGVVIMNVRPVKRTGFFSFLRAPKMEVTVALEEEGAVGRVVAPEQAVAREAEKAQKDAAVVKPDKPKQAEKPLTGIDLVAGLKSQQTTGSSMADLARAAKAGAIPPLKVSGETASAETEKKPEAEAVKEETPAQKDIASAQEIERKLDNLHSLLEQKIIGGPSDTSTSSVSRGSGASTGAASGEAEKEKEKDASAGAASGTSAGAESEEPDTETLSFIKLLYNTLLENEVDERYANELTDEAGKLSGPNMSLDAALANVYQKMVLKFGKPETITPAPQGAKAEIFIGPTGVGKTTTIAKLASKLHLQDKKKVALLTVDTYRIAAAEQLRTYATIMETPFRVIYSVDEMKQALDDFKDYDFIMIDTAGHSLHNEEQKENVASFIEAVTAETESEIFLVLSATTKYRDLVEIAEAYARMADYKLIFTKMDETGRAGNLYNMRLRTGAPMSYITNGQDVPDDIDVFNAQKIVKHLLGGK